LTVRYRLCARWYPSIDAFDQNCCACQPEYCRSPESHSLVLAVLVFVQFVLIAELKVADETSVVDFGEGKVILVSVTRN
jgi:hypothetical protein